MGTPLSHSQAPLNTLCSASAPRLYLSFCPYRLTTNSIAFLPWGFFSPPLLSA